MTAEEFRAKLEAQTNKELWGEERWEEMRRNEIDVQADYLTDLTDIDLFGEGRIRDMRSEHIDERVERLESNTSLNNEM